MDSIHPRPYGIASRERGKGERAGGILLSLASKKLISSDDEGRGGKKGSESQGCSINLPLLLMMNREGKEGKGLSFASRLPCRGKRSG